MTFDGYILPQEHVLVCKMASFPFQYQRKFSIRSGSSQACLNDLETIRGFATCLKRGRGRFDLHEESRPRPRSIKSNIPGMIRTSFVDSSTHKD